uniref:Uncharacterized protein n=1 Tax=Anopheles dirus TaxID=7168 RepID=A0A182NW59_9DIPT
GPVPSNRWLSFTVTTTVNFECCSPSDETHSKWASVNSSCSSITGPFSGCGFGWWPDATFPLAPPPRTALPDDTFSFSKRFFHATAFSLVFLNKFKLC